MRDLADAQQYSNERAREGADRKMRDQALGALMTTVEGRKLAWWLLDQCHVHATSFAGESTHVSAFREGERNIGLILFAELNRVCPNLLLTMTVENTKSKEIKNARSPEPVADAAYASEPDDIA